MKLLEMDDITADFHEVRITVDLPKLYVEIGEIYKASEKGPGYVIVITVTAAETLSICKQDQDTNSRRLEL